MIVTHMVKVRDVTAALQAIQKARSMGINVWYLPSGGVNDIQDAPVSHRIVVRGEEPFIEAFKVHEKEYI